MGLYCTEASWFPRKAVPRSVRSGGATMADGPRAALLAPISARIHRARRNRFRLADWRSQPVGVGRLLQSQGGRHHRPPLRRVLPLVPTYSGEDCHCSLNCFVEGFPPDKHFKSSSRKNLRGIFIFIPYLLIIPPLSYPAGAAKNTVCYFLKYF